MSYETLLLDVKDDVATITLNRPDKLNALNLDLCTEFRQACKDAVIAGARALVVTGKGRGFSTGAARLAGATPGAGTRHMISMATSSPAAMTR